MALQPSEVGAKCPKHEVFYETEWQESCCKTVQYCPECRKDEYSHFVKFLEGERGKP